MNVWSGLKRAGVRIAWFFLGFIVAPIYAMSVLSLWFAKGYYTGRKWSLKISIAASAVSSLLLAPFVLVASVILGPLLTALVLPGNSLKKMFAELKEDFIEAMKLHYYAKIWKKIQPKLTSLQRIIEPLTLPEKLSQAADELYEIMQEASSLNRKNINESSKGFNVVTKEIADKIFDKVSPIVENDFTASNLKSKNFSGEAINEILFLRNIEGTKVITGEDVAILKAIPQTSPFYYHAQYFIGEALFLERDYTQALSVWKKLPQGSHFYPEAALYLAEIFLQSSAPHKAIECLQPVKLLHDTITDEVWEEKLFLEGKAYFAINNHSMVNAKFCKISTDFNKYPEVKEILIENYLTQKYSNIKDKFDKDSPVLLVEAYRHGSSTDYKMAIKSLENKVSENFNDSEEASLMLGRRYLCYQILLEKIKSGYLESRWHKETVSNSLDGTNPYAPYINRLNDINKDSSFYCQAELLKLIKKYLESLGLYSYKNKKKVFKSLELFLLTGSSLPEFLEKISDNTQMLILLAKDYLVNDALEKIPEQYFAKMRLLLAKDFLAPANEGNEDFVQIYNLLSKIKARHGEKSCNEAQLLLAELYQKYGQHEAAIKTLELIPKKSELYTLAEKMRHFSIGYLSRESLPKKESDFQKIVRLKKAYNYLKGSCFGREKIENSARSHYLEIVKRDIDNLEEKYNKSGKPGLYIDYSNKLDAYWNNRDKKTIYSMKDCFFPADKSRREKYIAEFKQALEEKDILAIDAKLKEGQQFEARWFSSKYKPEANQYNLADLLVHFNNDLTGTSNHGVNSANINGL